MFLFLTTKQLSDILLLLNILLLIMLTKPANPFTLVNVLLGLRINVARVYETRTFTLSNINARRREMAHAVHAAAMHYAR